MSDLHIGPQTIIFSPTSFADMLLVTVKPRANAFIKRNVCHEIIICIFLQNGDGREVGAFLLLASHI